MNHNFLQLEFSGFNPEYELRDAIESIAEKLHLSSPSDSAMKVAIQKGKGVVQASCRIASHAGTFMADAVSDSPLRAIQKLDEKIRQQLEGWRRRRFANEEKGI